MRTKRLNKQERIVRRRKQLLVCSLLLITAICSSAAFTFKSNANTEKEVYKYYTSYEIQEGDSLWTIADKYMTVDYHNKSDYINEIKMINHMIDDDITSGESIIVAYYSFEEF